MGITYLEARDQVRSFKERQLTYLIDYDGYFRVHH